MIQRPRERVPLHSKGIQELLVGLRAGPRFEYRAEAESRILDLLTTWFEENSLALKPEIPGVEVEDLKLREMVRNAFKESSATYEIALMLLDRDIMTCVRSLQIETLWKVLRECRCYRCMYPKQKMLSLFPALERTLATLYKGTILGRTRTGKENLNYSKWCHFSLDITNMLFCDLLVEKPLEEQHLLRTKLWNLNCGEPKPLAEFLFFCSAGGFVDGGIKWLVQEDINIAAIRAYDRSEQGLARPI